jgi:hypothetical protein
MSGPDERFAIVPVPPVGPAPPEALVVGNMDAVMRCLPQTVASEEQEQRLAEQAVEIAKQQDANRAHTEQMVAMFADRVGHLSDRLDAFETRRQDHLEQQKRAEEAAEVAAAEELLALLPDPEDPEAFDNPRATGDDGELEIKPPPDTEKFDPEGEARNEAETGAMPTSLEKGAPPEAGQYVPTAPPPSKYRDPAAIGGN